MSKNKYKRKTHEDFTKEIYDLVGDEFTVLDTYNGTENKITIRHNNKKCNNYIFQVKPNDFLRGSRCASCSGVKRKTHQDFIKETDNLFEKQYIFFDTYVNSKTKLKGTCKTCSFDFYMSPNSILRNGIPCHCKKERLKKELSKRKSKQFADKIKSLYGNEYIFLENYQGARKEIKVEHSFCKTVWKTSPNYFFSFERKCPTCHHLAVGKYTDKEIRQRIYEKVENEYSLLSEYSGTDEKAHVIHNLCGHEWRVTLNSFLNTGSRCPKCKSFSLGEDKIHNILKELNIDYESEYIFDDCVYINKLRFDFAIFNSDGSIDKIIEYDGKQHFSPTYSEEEFELTQIRDAIKNNYCIDNGLILYRIPYTDFDDLDNIIFNVINNKDSFTNEFRIA